ncbi:MAG: N-acetylglucosamine-6-phosphate deacetylase [Bacteroidia bacterium]|nr:N-acetylglucosamine-6-phosphate deacetylase [Bacteroidia bacterium]
MDRLKQIKDKTVPFTIEAIHYETGNPVIIEIINGIIVNIREIAGLQNENNNLFVAPGLIDNQINGYANIDFSGSKLSAGDIIDAAKAIWRDGVTSFLPTLITNSYNNLIRNFSILDEALIKDNMLRESIPGFHLEGPYISPEDGYRGCHPVKYIRKPSWDEFTGFQKAAGGRIIQVTIAPELEGVMDFIKLCTRDGIVVAMGHTNASAEQIRDAVENGVKISTHLGNGCANFIHRHINPIWPQLANDQLTPSIIADGLHLLPEEIRVFYKVKGPDNIILTSDIIYLGGMAPGKYSFLENEVILTEEGMLLNTELNCLAGASFPLKKGVENIMNFTGCSLTKAINMASVNVARIYDLDDRGTLAPGKRADIILFERNGNQLQIKKTWLNGILVYQLKN